MTITYLSSNSFDLALWGDPFLKGNQEGVEQARTKKKMKRERKTGKRCNARLKSIIPLLKQQKQLNYTLKMRGNQSIWGINVNDRERINKTKS
jgi:hypothetical protein